MDNKYNKLCSYASTLNLFGKKKLSLNLQTFYSRLFLIGLLLFSVNQTQAQISFSKTTLIGTILSEPTSLDFGPDGRLYVAERTGSIYAYTVNKEGNNYQVLSTETIDLVQDIPNHNDVDGALNFSVDERQVTGILVVGTPANPIIYASSSDVRIGGGGGSDTGLDTNSGIISRLTYNGTTWSKVDLIRGLPRSEENHATNGLQYDAVRNILIVAQGGNTNAGAPSANFDHLCEYALSAAILEIDLTMLENMPILLDANSNQPYIYDIPTLDDPTRPNDSNGNDINDPFGGNDGLNQAKYIPGGPISIFSTGYRNQYDVVLTELGYVYTWDNGPNGGIGGHPDNEGSPNVTNNWILGEPGSNSPGPNDAKVNNEDGLHKVTQGYYAGHPTPIRANPLGAGLFTHENGPSQTGTFRTGFTGNPLTSLPIDWPPYPDSLKDLREADYQNPGVTDGSIYTREASTNGMDEYTSTAFGGAMKGDLLAVSFSGDLLRVDLDANGDLGPEGVTSIANQLGVPLDVTSLPNNSFFAGTIWVAEYSGHSIAVLEPSNNNTCLGADDNTIDEDGDGYTNSDEIQNGSNPCNPAIIPADFDKTLIGGFKVSNLNDPDDDDDGLLDNVDPFAQDAYNGLNTTLPLTNKLANGKSGLLDLGFTGLMTNGTTDYLDLIYNENDIIAGGAPELLVIPGVTDSTALGNSNNEVNAFQFGVKIDATTPPFSVSGKIVPPFLGTPPSSQQQHGIYIGTGDQDNYIKIVLHALNGNGGIQVIQENNGVATISSYGFSSLFAAAELELILSVNPAEGTVEPMVSFNGNFPFPLETGSISVSGNLLNAIQNTNVALAVGITASSAGSNSPFMAIWDDINLLFNGPISITSQWETINDGLNCTAFGNPGSCPTNRHEAGYVEVGDKFYLVGGRETNDVNIYDPITDIWTIGATAPMNLHHFQAIEYKGLLCVVGAFTGAFPNDTPVPNIYLYDPVTDSWSIGPEIPFARRRGAAAAAVHKGKIYLSGGIQNGHTGGRVAWLDEYDPTTNTWRILPDAPNDRDHVQAVVFDDKLYMVAGKQTNLGGNLNATVAVVDVFDFNTETWSSLPNPIPTPRGGSSLALLGNEILAIGGENVLGNGLNKTEALNLENNTWRILSNLNQNRHGTQAIVNNGVIYVATGSPNIGGGNSNSQEAFYFTQKNVPVFTPITQSLLSVEGDNLNTLNALQFTDNDETIILRNTVGTQAIILDDIDLMVGSSPTFNFTIANGATLPLIIIPGDSLIIDITTTSSTPADENGILTLIHSGNNAPQTRIILNEGVCEDADNDGFCVEEDCNDNDPALPATPGTLCNDGNPNTENDKYLADGCTCQGTGTGTIADCNGALFIGGNGEITVDNLLAISETIEIIGAGTNWIPVLICEGDCNDTHIIPNLLPGDYNVKLNMLGNDNSYCYREETVTVLAGPCTDIDDDGVCANVDCDDTDPNLPAIPGTVCDDGDTMTINDIYLTDGCTCQGTIPCQTDADGDGFCFDVDCDDNDPNLPTPPGTACNDGNINTVNDVIQGDSCTCAGSNGGGTANCDAILFSGGIGQIMIENLTASGEIVEIIGAPINWQIVPICNDNCANTQIIPNLAPGTYTVKVNMFGDDNTYCYIQEEVVVTAGCIDNDNDGICLPDDCDDDNPNIPALPGTPCNDGIINTINDVIQADSCTCVGTFNCLVDVDLDGVCQPDDCDDNNPNVPALPGTPCNDGIINTINDMIQADSCTCVGILTCPVDVDLDGVCESDDCDDNDPNVPAPPGTPCNDGSAVTFNDMILADGCTCLGIFICPIDVDLDGVCEPNDCNDNDPNVPAPPGTPCNDGNINTINDVILADGCTCQGILNCLADVDLDGVCQPDDCDDNDPNVPAPPGTPCNDGNINTINDMIFADGCTCIGTFNCLADVDLDLDGVCEPNDCDDNDPNVPAPPGTPCNDGNINTINDIILADGCTCQGILNCLVDVDLDGVCQPDDCDDNNPNVPALPGTPCNDGIINTINDMIQADSCTCVGILTCPVDVDLDGVCESDDCDDNDPNVPAPPGTPCNDGSAVTFNDMILADGCTCLGIFICPIDVDLDGVCEPNDCNDNDPNVPAPPGTPCNDGNINTINDVILADGCTCQGILNCLVDVDLDGVCQPDDCDDNNPNVPAIVGIACDDGDPNTSGDVYQADGCTCAGIGGGPANCDNVEFIGGNGILTLTGLTAAAEEISIIGAETNWVPILICAMESACENPYIIPNLPSGLYTVKLQMLGDNNSYCYKQEDVLVTDGSCTDGDNDGVCFELDCDDNNPNIPTTPGTSCDDGNPNTTGDVYQSDGCTCAGTMPCASDTDNDGVCDDVDCAINNPSLPALPGTSCDDGNPNTLGDIIQTDGCSCLGNEGGPANCDDVQFIGDEGSIALFNLTAEAEEISIIGSETNWIPILVCAEIDPCSNPYFITDLSPGTYTIKLQMFGDDNSYCYRQEDVVVTASTVSSSTATNRASKVLAFTAYPNQQTVEMEWLNNTGYKNDEFVLERSGDGIDFESIAIYNAAGATDEVRKFKELDTNPLEGDNYYRLKLIYTDGDFEYTPIEKVTFNKLSDFGVFPNPVTHDAIFIDLSLYNGKDVTISIKDQPGRTMYTEKIINLSTRLHRINLSDFDNGLYIIQVQTAGRQLVAKKLLVTRFY